MMGYVALLRGVNVGSRRIRMPDLAEVFRSLGHADVRTYVQSGNVVFSASRAGRDGLVRDIEQRLGERFGAAITVLLRSKSALRSVVEDNAFLRGGADPRTLHVTFLAGQPDSAWAGAAGAGPDGVDEFEVRGREVYVHCPGGYGRTKLTNAWWEKRLGVPATTRNWRTVTTLAESVPG